MDATLNESFPPVTSFPDTTATPQPTIEIPFSPTVPSGSPLPEPTITFPGDLPSSDEASPCGQAPESQGRAFIRAERTFSLAGGPYPFRAPSKEWVPTSTGGQWVHSLSLSGDGLPPQEEGGPESTPPPPSCISCDPAPMTPVVNNESGTSTYSLFLAESWKCTANNTWFLEKVQWLGSSDIRGPKASGGVQFSGLITFEFEGACPQITLSGSGRFEFSMLNREEKKEESYFTNSTLDSSSSTTQMFEPGLHGIDTNRSYTERQSAHVACNMGPRQRLFGEKKESFYVIDKKNMGKPFRLTLETERVSKDYNGAGVITGGYTIKGNQNSEWDLEGGLLQSQFNGLHDQILGPNQIVNIALLDLTKRYFPSTGKLQDIRFGNQWGTGIFRWTEAGRLLLPTDPVELANFDALKLFYQFSRTQAQEANLPNSLGWPEVIADQ